MDLNQVTLRSRDVARGAAFYRKLGLLQIVEDLPTYVRFEMPSGNSTLSLHYVERLNGGVECDLGTVPYFECETLDATVRELKAAGIVFETDPTDQPWLWREASLRDPDGHEIRLYYAGTNRKNPPWRLAASPSYRIRLARPEEVPRIDEIEDKAGTLFSGLGLINEKLDTSFPVDDLVRLVAMKQVWVATTENDLPVGVVIASVRDGTAYVEEMAVLPAHGKRGLGGRLLATVCNWAQTEGHTAITLSTFRDVPWNGPFYRKQGFRELQPAEWTPGMSAIRKKEAQHGLHVEARVFMRRKLVR